MEWWVTKLHSFFISIVFFEVSLSMLKNITALFYAYNMLSKIECVVTILWSNMSPYSLIRSFEQTNLALYYYKNLGVW